jgi:succinyl-CoA synthetase beta subunit
VGLKGKAVLIFGAIIKSLYSIFLEYDAILVEVNPLALTNDNEFIAADAKIILDDNASFRHRKLFSELVSARTSPTEGPEYRKSLAEKAGIPTYIEMDGNIGIISDGAGTGMSTLDLTKDFSGEVEVYCELGGRVTPKLIEEAMNISLLNENVRVLLLNLIGGLNRMDEMAEGITTFLSKKKQREAVSKSEIVVRMSGTLEEEGRRMLQDAGVASFDNIYDAIQEAVELSKGA